MFGVPARIAKLYAAPNPGEVTAGDATDGSAAKRIWRCAVKARFTVTLRAAFSPALRFARLGELPTRSLGGRN